MFREKILLNHFQIENLAFQARTQFPRNPCALIRSSLVKIQQRFRFSERTFILRYPPCGTGRYLFWVCRVLVDIDRMIGKSIGLEENLQFSVRRFHISTATFHVPLQKESVIAPFGQISEQVHASKNVLRVNTRLQEQLVSFECNYSRNRPG